MLDGECGADFVEEALFDVHAAFVEFFEFFVVEVAGVSHGGHLLFRCVEDALERDAAAHGGDQDVGWFVVVVVGAGELDGFAFDLFLDSFVFAVESFADVAELIALFVGECGVGVAGHAHGEA